MVSSSDISRILPSCGSHRTFFFKHHRSQDRHSYCAAFSNLGVGLVYVPLCYALVPPLQLQGGSEERGASQQERQEGGGGGRTSDGQKGVRYLTPARFIETRNSGAAPAPAAQQRSRLMRIMAHARDGRTRERARGTRHEAGFVSRVVAAASQQQ